MSDTLAPVANGTTMKGVLIPCNGTAAMTQLSLGKKNLLEQVAKTIGGSIELHACAYAPVTETFTQELQSIRTFCVFACDEMGMGKQLPFNERASIMAGIRVVGDSVFFLDQSSDDEPHRNLLLSTMTLLLDKLG